MSITSILQQVKAYYNKDGFVVSMDYKGHPISATGSSEASVYKSIANIMAFVDYVEEKKQKQNQVLESRELATA